MSRHVPAARPPVALLLVVSTFVLGASVSPAAVDPPAVAFELVASGLGQVTSIAQAGDERLLVTSLDGRIWLIDHGSYSTVPFLDLRDRVVVDGVRGLLSVALHPDYPSRNAVFVNYIGAGRTAYTSRFAVTADPNQADPASERVLLAIPHARGAHNGGQLAFGPGRDRPDGYLYVSSGDDGGADDPDCNGQNPSTLLGKLLRLDVDHHIDSAPYYAIPPDNPFVGAGPPLDEIWALGLRNPWRFSFDRTTGDLWLGDVGQDREEEVDWQAAFAPGGNNYGWKALEGNVCTGQTAGCATPPPACDSAAYTAPILTYPHGTGDCSITGGYVYRGSEIPGLAGHYLYGDFCSGILRATPAAPETWSPVELAARLPGITTFGEDARGELYLAADDKVYRLVNGEAAAECIPGDRRLCLEHGRFEVTMTWRRDTGETGNGHAVPQSANTGNFWFFDPTNTEVLVKVLDACSAPFHHYWVFAAGLTNVEVTWTVTDTQTRQVRRYVNPLGTPFLAVQDTRAFATCP
jgi:glucose/arabinose dehydrogenase